MAKNHIPPSERTPWRRGQILISVFDPEHVQGKKLFDYMRCTLTVDIAIDTMLNSAKKSTPQLKKND